MGGLVRLGPMRSEKLEVQFRGWGCSGEPVVAPCELLCKAEPGPLRLPREMATKS